MEKHCDTCFWHCKADTRYCQHPVSRTINATLLRPDLISLYWKGEIIGPGTAPASLMRGQAGPCGIDAKFHTEAESLDAIDVDEIMEDIATTRFQLGLPSRYPSSVLCEDCIHKSGTYCAHALTPGWTFATMRMAEQHCGSRGRYFEPKINNGKAD